LNPIVAQSADFTFNSTAQKAGKERQGMATILSSEKDAKKELVEQVQQLTRDLLEATAKAATLEGRLEEVSKMVPLPAVSVDPALKSATLGAPIKSKAMTTVEKPETKSKTTSVKAKGSTRK
jgi:hypothetical protein